MPEDLIAVNSDFWSLLRRLQSSRQSWGCEVVGHYFNRRRQLSLDAGQPNPFHHNGGTIVSSQFAEDTLKDLSSNAPESFVREILPFMRAVISDCTLREQGGLLLDPIWSNRIFGSSYSTASALLSATEDALCRLAISDPESYQSIFDPLCDSPFETIQYLLIRSLAANGSLFADEGVDQLCKGPGHLKIGYSSDQHWAARQLIEAVSPHCSDEKLGQLEGLLLEYYTDWERSISGRQTYGYAQFTLLSGIIESRRSSEVSKRLEELRRNLIGRSRRLQSRWKLNRLNHQFLRLHSRR